MNKEKDMMLLLFTHTEIKKYFNLGLPRRKKRYIMTTTTIKTRDGRIIKLVLDKIVSVDCGEDNYISVTMETGMYTIYFDEDSEDINHLDDISDSIISGGIIMAKTVVFSK